MSEDSAGTAPGDDAILVLTPHLDDWTALSLLLDALDRVFDAERIAARVLIVDDGSRQSAPPGFAAGPFRALDRVEVLELRRNVGHQRAIALGLAHVEAHDSCGTVVVMDSDGEDAPSEVPRLLRAYDEAGGRAIIFAERAKRSESLAFRAFYRVYTMLFRLLTGRRIRFGNFSVIPRRRLTSLVAVSELWNHYVAAVLKSRQEIRTIPTARGKRLHGRSRMNLVSLVIHGLSAISVESEVVGVRLLLASCVLIAMALAGILVTVSIRLFTSMAIPGWATTAFGLLVLLLLQAVLLATIFSFVTLSGRQGLPFLPCRDHAHYIHRRYTLWSRP